MPKILPNQPRLVTTPKTDAATARPAAAGATATPAGWSARAGQTTQAATAAPIPDRQKAIVCPVLASMVNEGRVKLSPDGALKLSDLRDATKDLKMDAGLRAGLTATGVIANRPQDILHNTIHGEMNVLDLRSGPVKHPGDSAILTAGKFDQGKFDALVSHAEFGVMTVDSFAKAISANVQRDLIPGQKVDTLVRGKNFSAVEFGALLASFGKTDPKSGKLGISVEDMRALYQDKKLPAANTATLVEATALSASLAVKADAALASTAFRSLATATGLSDAGARISGGKEVGATAAGQAAVGAGKAANCPHMANAGAMPRNVNDVVNAHTPAGLSE